MLFSLNYVFYEYHSFFHSSFHILLIVFNFFPFHSAYFLCISRSETLHTIFYFLINFYPFFPNFIFCWLSLTLSSFPLCVLFIHLSFWNSPHNFLINSHPFFYSISNLALNLSEHFFFLVYYRLSATSPSLQTVWLLFFAFKSEWEQVLWVKDRLLGH